MALTEIRPAENDVETLTCPHCGADAEARCSRCGYAIDAEEIQAAWALKAEERRAALTEAVRGGESLTAAARRLKIRYATAHALMKGVDAGMPAEVVDLRGRRQPRRKPTEADIAERRASVAACVAQGLTSPQIAAKLGIALPVAERDAARVRRLHAQEQEPGDDIALAAPGGATVLVGTITTSLRELVGLRKLFGGRVPVANPKAAAAALDEWRSLIRAVEGCFIATEEEPVVEPRWGRR